MRVSEYFNLNRTQPTLDFVDVDIRGDIKLFLDPRALLLLPSEWAAESIALIQDFFRHVLREIQAGNHDRARGLLAALREPNEVHLGLSTGRARGVALGNESANDVWESLRTSQAVHAGLLEDLEDTILMIPGISSDRVSDIAINLMRQPLIRYTQEQAQLHGIPLTNDVDSGPLWDPHRHLWYSQFTQLPMTNEGKLMLVPKSIVRRSMTYDYEEYYRHYILEHLQQVELNANSGLVQVLKDGSRRVTKQSLIEKYGTSKTMSVEVTRNEPSILQRYRRDKETMVVPPLTHDEFAHDENTPPPNWDALLQTVRDVPPGNVGTAATDYEKAIEPLLTALFYPALSYAQFQFPLHQGRKRVDITFSNTDQAGFFHWIGEHYPAAHVFVECKNFVGHIGNPELDQLAGRFSPTRGQFGLLICRSIQDKNLYVERCRDTANDHRGFIIPLDDADLSELVEFVRNNPGDLAFPMLRALFQRIVA